MDALERIEKGFKGGAPQGLQRALSLSQLVSADMAHAVHPNYADKHESGHRPVIGKGPVIKVNSNQSYATDSSSSGFFAALCSECEIEPQYFVSRSDLVCGSTIGPITAARLGVRTVDVGNLIVVSGALFVPEPGGVALALTLFALLYLSIRRHA